jgi:hypothetical protein
MSINRLMLLQQAGTPADEPEAPDWLLQMLREMMTAVAQEEGDTLKKASMIARLGALYLRASGAQELKRAHRELARRCAQLEEQLATLQARAAAVPPPPAELNQIVRPAYAPAVPTTSITVPFALEPEAPPILAAGTPEGRARAPPTT